MAKQEKKYFEDDYGNIHGKEVVTFIGRLIYGNIATPNTYNPKAPSYGGILLLPKTECKGFTKEFIARQMNTIKDIHELAEDVVSEHSRAKKFDHESWLKDGDEKLTKDDEPNPVFKGHWYINLNNTKQIPCCDRNKEDLAYDFIKDGMKVRATAKVVASTPSNTYKVSLKPTLIQFVEDDGIRLGVRDAKATLNELDDLPMDDLEDTINESPKGNSKGKKDESFEHDSLDQV